jgi:hypothetical protein
LFSLRRKGAEIFRPYISSVVELTFHGVRGKEQGTGFPPTACGNDRLSCPNAVVGHPATFDIVKFTAESQRTLRFKWLNALTPFVFFVPFVVKSF